MNKKYLAGLLSFFLVLSASLNSSFAQIKIDERSLPAYFHGITFENTNKSQQELKQPLDQIKKIPVPVVVRVVFQKDTVPDDYKFALSELRKMSNVFVIGLFLDSEALREYRLDDKLKREFAAKRPLDAQKYADLCNNEKDRKNKSYPKRINCFLDLLNDSVDIWEVGNEVNGDWADEGKTGKPEAEKTVQKILFALEAVKTKNGLSQEKKAIALTLVHMPGCTKKGWERNEMLVWVDDNLKGKVNGTDLNYLLVSYYEDNCDGGTATTIAADAKMPRSAAERRNLYWTKLFSDLDSTLPGAKHLGFGEVGYSSEVKTCRNDFLSYCSVCDGDEVNFASKIELMERYYRLSVNNPKYVGGHFWWNGQEDIMLDPFFQALMIQFERKLTIPSN